MVVLTSFVSFTSFPLAKNFSANYFSPPIILAISLLMLRARPDCMYRTIRQTIAV